MKDTIRLRKFFIDLDQLLQDNEYYDDDLQTEVINITKEQCYDMLMENEEYHLLTKQKVEAFIDLFISDYSSRMNILRTFKAL
jgi:hypothetical protein